MNIELPGISWRYYFKFNEKDKTKFPVWEYKNSLWAFYNSETKELTPPFFGMIIYEYE